MKTFLQIAVCKALLLVTTNGIVAQEKIEISTNPPAPAVSLPVVRQVRTAKVTYNERKDETVAQTPFLLVYGESLNGILIHARFSSSGKTLIIPEVITLRISPTAGDRTYVDDRRFKVLVDGKEILNAPARFVSANSDGRIIVASLEEAIPYELFAKLSRGHNVMMQVGPTTFALRDSDLETFRDLLDCIK